jgi:hypothetical protein
MVASFPIFLLDVLVVGKAAIIHLNSILCLDIHQAVGDKRESLNNTQLGLAKG